MKKRQPTLPEPHDQMLENYNLAIENMPMGQKSAHWDVFPEDYEKAIESIDKVGNIPEKSTVSGFQ